ncbi:glycosyltransferase family 2 protein [Algoriphagus sp. NBT04N3]|jgi:poly-beta-1,6-N-acetyl-D-glucosamine synthase|uniref:glycosyltransferase family 2 protein n=1 Tax=Algoriphagus sp. NBT04N3 TaxID=2705473 RepID=UPI001C630E86|nr:glycosyltransferase [Algoriphagus sp. NBT04N3]QYH38491.1 glycosyltransferase family 2 protein [Algoriphagus sp. NBT04N3]
MYNFLFYFLIELIGLFYLILSFSVIVIYFIIMILSALEMRDYRRKNRFADYEDIITSPIAPGVSILAPAYNEGSNIVQNVKSLLSLHYGKFEVIIINDGSKDDTLTKLLDAFELQKVSYAYNPEIITQEVKGVYKSQNKSYRRLTVIDKENGGKADALNAGINISQMEILACIDVDCILANDSLTRMVRPFMEETNRKVIAVGGAIGIANNCDVQDGTVTKYRVPQSTLGQFQVIEYCRAFLMGRMAWTRINGLMLISGAFGFFRRDLVLNVGGYFPKTVGEDMELVVRMRRYMEEKKIPYKVSFIPDPLCWTEVPEDVEVLGRQRNRWMRGTIETLQLHRKIGLNPKFGILGTISYPFWSVFEKMAPIVEIFGLIYTLILLIIGDFSAIYFVALLFMIYLLSLLVSSFSILYEQVSYNNYKNKNDLKKLIWIILIEPLYIHPKVLLWGLKGHLDFIIGKGGWGQMIRTGFKTAEERKTIEAQAEKSL